MSRAPLTDTQLRGFERALRAQHPDHTIIVSRRERQPGDAERIAAILARDFDTPKPQKTDTVSKRRPRPATPAAPNNDNLEQAA